MVSQMLMRRRQQKEVDRSVTIGWCVGMYLCMLGLTVALTGGPRPTIERLDADPEIQLMHEVAHDAVHGGHVSKMKQFWGLPYAIAAMNAVTRLDYSASQLLVAWLCGLGVTILSHMLWGGRVACGFLVVNWSWMHTVVFGSTEPLFMLFILTAFLCARSHKWGEAAVSAALSVWVRPVGVFALCAIAIALVHRRDWKSLSRVVLAGTIVLAIYGVAAWRLGGSPFGNIVGYSEDFKGHSFPITIPFYAITVGLVRTLRNGPLLNCVRVLGFMSLVLAAFLRWIRNDKARESVPWGGMELAFFFSYGLFLFSYSSEKWAYAEFPRFAVPLMPFVCLVYRDWIPVRRGVMLLLGTTTCMLAALSMYGVYRLWHSVL